MSKYLFEVGVEELPYKFIPMAIDQLKQGFEKFLNDNNVDFNNVKVMATPRRLAVIVDGLAVSQPDVEKVVKGPIAKVAFDEHGNLSKAGEGFANKNGVSNTPNNNEKILMKYLDKPQRQITEIRIFYDDQTWETFVPKK